MKNETGKVKVLHGTFEYDIASVGGINSVTTGLTPALAKKGFDVSIVTPGYDIFFKKYNSNLEKITTITHIYKGKTVKSNIFRRVVEIIDEEPLYHYLLSPVNDSPVAWLFNIKDGANVYHSFNWSEMSNRREYFNSALAAMIKMTDEIPEFDIYHSHVWHTGLASVIMKEMDHLPKWQALNCTRTKPLKKTPKIIATFHVLLNREHGELTGKNSVSAFLNSLGLPHDFTEKFAAWKQYINPAHLKQVVLAFLYADQVTTVSEGLANEASHVKGGGCGLDKIFNWLKANQRFEGILNGIPHAKYDACSQQNLQEFTLDPDNITAGKYKLKQHLAEKYKHLDPNKPWFGFIGRFAQEKGMDMLLTAHEEITRQGGVLIIMGKHVVVPKNIDGKLVHEYQALLDQLRQHPNVLVIDDPEEQALVGHKIRAATDITLMLSHNEACGLPQMEGFANATFSVAPAIQGIPDTVKDLDLLPETGTGFLYNDTPLKRHANLKAAITKATNFYTQKLENGTLDPFLRKIWQNSKQYDWNENPAKKYAQMYRKVLRRSELTYDQIRTVLKPMLSMLTVYDKKANESQKRTLDISSLDSCFDLFIDKPKEKIFQIGFNKCGTQTLYHGFVGSKVRSVHYGVHHRTIASIIYDNYNNGRKLLAGIEEYTAYFDLEDIYYPGMPLNIGTLLYKELDRQYPGSKFILNTRNKEKWLKSRFTQIDPINGKVYAEVLCERYNYQPYELYVMWSKEWDQHHKDVLEYFADRTGDLLVYDIENDTPEKVCDFFATLNLDVSKFQHANATMNNYTARLWDEIRGAKVSR